MHESARYNAHDPDTRERDDRKPLFYTDTLTLYFDNRDQYQCYVTQTHQWPISNDPEVLDREA